MDYKHYSKPWISLGEQVSHLKANGLQIEDENRAKAHLKRIGYYRLSGYWFPFRERSGKYCPLDYSKHKKKKKGYVKSSTLDDFRNGASFKNAVDLYVFDKKLRLLTLDALERIEIALRVDVSHFLGELDTFAYLRPELFFEEFSCLIDKKTGRSAHHDWLTHHSKLVSDSREDFMKHNKEKYGLPLPIWVVCEVWNFNMLSRLFSGMREQDQDALSKKYGLSNGRIFASWIHSLSYLRNVCAHHSRLWNRNIVQPPKLPSNKEFSLSEVFDNDNHAKNRPFLLFCLTLQLLNYINPSSSWGERFLKLVDNDFPDLSHMDMTIDAMGTIPGWREWWETKSETKKNP